MSTAKNPYIKSKANGKENSQQGRPVPKEQGKQAQKKDHADKKRKEPVWMWGRSTQGEEKKEGVDKTRKEEWQYRPVVLKKFKPDPVMTQFFTVVKSKKATHHHNHQGFPKKQCWFAANLDDYYYVNPEYVEKYPMVVKMYKEDGLYIACRYCKLGPCVVTKGHRDLSDGFTTTSTPICLPALQIGRLAVQIHFTKRQIRMAASDLDPQVSDWVSHVSLIW